MLNNQPASITLICNKCGHYGEKDTDGLFNHSSLHIRREGWSTPLRVEGIGGRSRTYDLCRLCTNAINRTIEAEKLAALANWRSV